MFSEICLSYASYHIAPGSDSEHHQTTDMWPQLFSQPIEVLQ